MSTDNKEAAELSDLQRRVEEFRLLAPYLRSEARSISESTHVYGIRRELPIIIDNNAASEVFLYPANTKEPTPVLFCMHGGGFAIGDALIIDSICESLCKQANVHVININYCKAPEHPFPQALEQIEAIVKLVATEGFELKVIPQRFILMGFSAGANLAAGVSMNINKEKYPLLNIAGLILHYPFLDASTPAYMKSPVDGGVPQDMAEVFDVMYAPASLRNDPLVSPICAQLQELAVMPPTLLMPADRDALCEECERYASKLLEAGVDARLVKVPGTCHGYVEEAFFPDLNLQLSGEPLICSEESITMAKKALEISANFINEISVI